MGTFSDHRCLYEKYGACLSIIKNNLITSIIYSQLYFQPEANRKVHINKEKDGTYRQMITLFDDLDGVNQ